MDTETPSLVICGLGYTGTAVALTAHAAGFRVSGTTRDPARRQTQGDWAIDWDATGPAIAGATHLLIYGLLLALPLVGWARMSAHEMELSLFGLTTLPPLVQEDSDFADTLGNVHVGLAWGLLALVLAHAVAALWHHHVRRDGVLRAMLPGRD